MFFGSNPSAWGKLATALGLKPYLPGAGYAHGMSFRQVQRSLGVPVEHQPPSFRHVLHGFRRGVEVVVLQYEIQRASSTTKDTYTGMPAPPPRAACGPRRRYSST